MERIDVLRRLWELREAGMGKQERIEAVEAERGNAPAVPDGGHDWDLGASPPAWAGVQGDELDLDILG